MIQITRRTNFTFYFHVLHSNTLWFLTQFKIYGPQTVIIYKKCGKCFKKKTSRPLVCLSSVFIKKGRRYYTNNFHFSLSSVLTLPLVYQMLIFWPYRWLALPSFFIPYYQYYKIYLHQHLCNSCKFVLFVCYVFMILRNLLFFSSPPHAVTL